MARSAEMVGCGVAVVLRTDPGSNCVEARGSSIDLHHFPSCQLQLLINDRTCVALIHFAFPSTSSSNHILVRTTMPKSVYKVLNQA